MRHCLANGGVILRVVLYFLVVFAISSASGDYNCPIDCHCTLSQHTHTPLLHARCTSLRAFWRTKKKTINTSIPLHSLDLSNLKLLRLAHALDKLPDLMSVDLSHNQLHEIGHLGRRIKRLNLKDNHLKSDKLHKLPRYVQRLNLQHNDITYLPRDFMKLHQLQWLELSHNHLNCSCDTLEVRNWLMERAVEIQNPVVCAQPDIAYGKDWKQVNRSEICESEKRAHLLWHSNEANGKDDGELMLGDQPIDNSEDEDSLSIVKEKSRHYDEHKLNHENEESEDEDEDEDELKHSFLLITEDYADLHKSHKLTRSSSRRSLEIEGSGDDFDFDQQTTEHLQLPDTLKLDDGDDESDDGSGSGDSFIFVPSIRKVPIINEILETFKDHNENQTAADGVDDDGVFKGGMGIFEGAGTTESASSSEVDDHQEHLGHIPSPTTDAPDIEELVAGAGASAEGIKHNRFEESPEENNATYILLGIVGAVVVALCLYVAIKRCQQRPARRRRPDAENPQREMIDMDKKNLGKPLRNGMPEHVPLISEKTKPTQVKPMNGAANSHKKAIQEKDVKDGVNGGPQKEPLLRDQAAIKDGVLLQPKTIQAPLNDEGNEEHNPMSSHEYYPISPRYPTPKSPRASKYIQPLPEMNNNHEPDDRYISASPKSGRYSPVYSPETGRVKIKLTETPRPKTPMLVQRSRSNAGEIISVPLTTVAAGDGQLDQH